MIIYFTIAFLILYVLLFFIGILATNIEFMLLLYFNYTLTACFGHRCGGVSAAGEAVVPARRFVDPEVHQGIAVQRAQRFIATW